MANLTSAALSYHEPSIVIILIQSSFLLLLNAINHVLDKILYCGLVGQVLLGIAWGTPGGKLLGEEFEHVVVQLGYLGLIVLVYEGNIFTSTYILHAGTCNRRPFNFISFSKGQSVALHCCSDHGHKCPNCPFVFPPRTSRSFASASICCWSCVVFDKFRHYLYHPRDERTR